MLGAMSRYEFALEAHSTLRLLLTVVCALLFVGGLRGWFSHRGPGLASKLLMILGVIFADLQLVLGLLLYFVWSPFTSQARADFGAAMKDPTLRFWAVEHASAMLLAVACVHIGKVLVKRADGNEASECRRMVLWFGLALALILLVSPWPFSTIVRPLLRLGPP